MGLIKRANEFFKKSEYQMAYSLYKEAANRYGENVVKHNLKACEKQLDLNMVQKNSAINNINESIQAKVSNLQNSFAIEQEITEDNNLSNKYKKIYSISQQISEKNSSQEFDFLLEYANELRRVEMSETYFKIIKYLLVQFDRLSEKNQKNMLLHLSNAIKLSRDEKLIHLILEHRIDLVADLILSPKTKDVILGTSLSTLHNYQINDFKFFNFDLHTEPQKAVSLLLTNNIDLKNLTPDTYCLFCNLYAENQESNRAERYKIFFNKYLSANKLPMIKSINLNSQNILSSIEFDNLTVCSEGPLVSIIMSAYNAEDTIDYAIISLLRQSYQNIEILVCDDQSNDDTLEKIKILAKTDHRIKVYQSIKNQGTYNIRNNLILEAKGKYVTFQDSDDYALPNRIEVQVENLMSSGKSMCCTQWVRITPSGSFVFFHDDKLSRFCVVSSMVKKEVFQSIPPFRNSLVAADTEFYEHMCCQFGEDQILKLEEPLILGLWGDGSLTKTPNLTAENNGFVAEKRRAYSDIAARQRVLGKEIIPDDKIQAVLVENNIHRENHGVVEYLNGELN